MNIFTRLAAEHITKLAHYEVGGDTPVIPGSNDLRPSNPPEAPVTLKADSHGPLTDLYVKKHKETMHGELSRAFDNFVPSVTDWHNTIGNVMSAKIDEISGSSAASQALARHRGA